MAAKKKASLKTSAKERNRREENRVAEAQMEGVIKKGGTSKTSGTAADQEVLAANIPQSKNTRG